MKLYKIRFNKNKRLKYHATDFSSNGFDAQLGDYSFSGCGQLIYMSTGKEIEKIVWKTQVCRHKACQNEMFRNIQNEMLGHIQLELFPRETK